MKKIVLCIVGIYSFTLLSARTSADSLIAERKDSTSTIMTEGGFTLFGSYAGLFEIANEYNSEVILDAQYRPTSREHQMMYAFLPPSLGGKHTSSDVHDR